MLRLQILRDQMVSDHIIDKFLSTDVRRRWIFINSGGHIDKVYIHAALQQISRLNIILVNIWL